MGSLETKIIIKLIAQRVAKSESVEEAYMAIADAVDTEGMKLPSFEEAKNSPIINNGGK